MKKHNENLFAAKFRLLNSQENSEESEEIIWSSSDSCEFEDVNKKPNLIKTTKQPKKPPTTNKKPNRKRKRKSKGPKNFSKLEVTIIDALPCKTKPKMIGNVLNDTYSVPNLPECKGCESILTSPVLCTGATRANLSIKSPVIAQKYASPIHSPKVRKSLFSETKNNNKVEIEQRSGSPIVRHQLQPDRRKPVEGNYMKVQIETSSDTPILETQDSNGFQEDDILNRVHTRNKNNIELIKKVIAFDYHFNSESSALVSIAPKSTFSDDLLILTITYQTPNENSVKATRHTEAEKSKENGLAYRLNSLIKKHNTNISLWRHERFRAENSNIIREYLPKPKEEYLVFRIQKVIFKYGSYLLEAVDWKHDVFQILINKDHVNGCTVLVDSVFKLYEPYQIVHCDENKLIVNVCKFQCRLQLCTNVMMLSYPGCSNYVLSMLK